MQANKMHYRQHAQTSPSKGAGPRVQGDRWTALDAKQLVNSVWTSSEDVLYHTPEQAWH